MESSPPNTHIVGKDFLRASCKLFYLQFCILSDQWKKTVAKTLLPVEEHFYNALCDLEPFVQFKKREKYPWRIASACDFTKRSTSPWVFFTFFKLYKWYQIAQSVTYESNYNCYKFCYEFAFIPFLAFRRNQKQ